MAEGRAERESVPLEAHGEWATPERRPDPVGILEKQNATRVPELVPIRHGRMIVSPCTFYRGSAAIMACDLSRSPATALPVQCCGDAHLSNFGLFAAPTGCYSNSSSRSPTARRWVSIRSRCWWERSAVEASSAQWD